MLMLCAVPLHPFGELLIHVFQIGKTILRNEIVLDESEQALDLASPLRMIWSSEYGFYSKSLAYALKMGEITAEVAFELLALIGINLRWDSVFFDGLTQYTERPISGSIGYKSTSNNLT
jgi:hypothetical protein